MDFPGLIDEVAAFVAGFGPREPDRAGAQDRLQALCDFLHKRVPHYDWFGFYIARRSEALLDLGPFSGEPTEHVLIPFGKGICGQAAASGETFLVDDVSAASNYLACSLKVKSEIVVPVFAPEPPIPGELALTPHGRQLTPHGHQLVGEIDIDSHSPAAFKPEDRAFLESLAPQVAADLAALRR